MARRKQAGKDLQIVDNIPQLETDNGPAKGYTRYAVTRPVSQLSHTEQVYLVINGFVDLPTGQEWYQPLISKGTLKGI